jgi:hypothetical protein
MSRLARASIGSSHGQPHDAVSFALYQTAKSTLDRDTAPSPAPEPIDIAKELVKRAGSASEQMLELARAHNAANPKMSPEQSFVAVYTHRRNVGLKNRMNQEEAELRDQAAYRRDMNAPYTNPHRPPTAGGTGTTTRAPGRAPVAPLAQSGSDIDH